MSAYAPGGDTVLFGGAGNDTLIGYTGDDTHKDGKSDILFEKYDGSFALWLLNDTTILSTDTIASPGTASFFKGLGDFNRDGVTDILFERANGT